MTIAEWMMIAAVLLAPLTAVQVQKWLEGWREKKERKKQIFTTLMATRATRIDPSHVTALNMIDLEFKETSVLEKWREYLDCLAEVPEIPAANSSADIQQTYKNVLNNWTGRHDDKFIDLLYEMSRVLKYKFDKVYLKKSIYYPRGLSDLEMEQQIFRRAAISFLSGQHPVKMNVTDFPSPNEDKEVVQMEAKLREYLLLLMEGKKSIPVTISPAEGEQK